MSSHLKQMGWKLQACSRHESFGSLAQPKEHSLHYPIIKCWRNTWKFNMYVGWCRRYDSDYGYINKSIVLFMQVIFVDWQRRPSKRVLSTVGSVSPREYFQERDGHKYFVQNLSAIVAPQSSLSWTVASGFIASKALPSDFLPSQESRWPAPLGIPLRWHHDLPQALRVEEALRIEDTGV